MHSLAMAQDILKAALTEAKKSNARRIISINVKIGDGHFADPDSLKFCLEAEAKGTIAEGARIDIEHMTTTVRCPDCDVIFFPFATHFKACPRCGNRDLETLGADEHPQVTLELD